MKKWPKRVKPIAILLMLLLLSVGIIFVGWGFCGTSISAVATCHVPYIITTSDGKKVASDNEPGEQEKELISTPKENKEAGLAKTNPNMIEQQQEKNSADNKQVELITTVCAK